MSGPLFIVELSPEEWIAGNYYHSYPSYWWKKNAKRFPSEIAAQSALNYMRRLEPFPDAKIIRVDDGA